MGGRVRCRPRRSCISSPSLATCAHSTSLFNRQVPRPPEDEGLTPPGHQQVGRRRVNGILWTGRHCRQKAQLNHRCAGKRLKGIRPTEEQVQRNAKTSQLPGSCSHPRRKSKKHALGDSCFLGGSSLLHQRPQLKIQFAVPEPNLPTPKLCLFCRKANCLPRIPFSLNSSQSL